MFSRFGTQLFEGTKHRTKLDQQLQSPREMEREFEDAFTDKRNPRKDILMDRSIDRSIRSRDVHVEEEAFLGQLGYSGLCTDSTNFECEYLVRNAPSASRLWLAGQNRRTRQINGTNSNQMQCNLSVSDSLNINTAENMGVRTQSMRFQAQSDID